MTETLICGGAGTLREDDDSMFSLQVDENYCMEDDSPKQSGECFEIQKVHMGQTMSTLMALEEI